MNVIEYFSMRQWDFQSDNINKLWAKLSSKEQKIFFFDMSKIDWDFFLENYFRGIRQYLLHDPLDTVPEALIRWNKLYWLHQSMKLFVTASALRIIWSFLSMFYK